MDVNIPQDDDICRICRLENSQLNPLFHPCLCAGSIKYIHQDCLEKWLNQSKKTICELCKYKFTFKPIYSPNMPAMLSLDEIFKGVKNKLFIIIRTWFHFSLLVTCWIILVPFLTWRLYKFLFFEEFWELILLPWYMLSGFNFNEVINGGVVICLTLLGFMSLIWLKDQINIHEGLAWLDEEQEPNQPHPPQQADPPHYPQQADPPHPHLLADQPQPPLQADQPQPPLQADQPQPHLLADQPQSHLLADQPQPHPLADQPHPPLQADQPQPHLLADQSQPYLLADQPHPTLQADQPQPHLQADQPQPHLQADQPQPHLLADQSQPNLQTITLDTDILKLDTDTLKLDTCIPKLDTDILELDTNPLKLDTDTLKLDTPKVELTYSENNNNNNNKSNSSNNNNNNNNNNEDDENDADDNNNNNITVQSNDEVKSKPEIIGNSSSSEEIFPILKNKMSPTLQNNNNNNNNNNKCSDLFLDSEFSSSTGSDMEISYSDSEYDTNLLDNHTENQNDNNQQLPELEAVQNDHPNINFPPQLDIANEFNQFEDLDWERMIGLDGTLHFIEHIFWIICLNFMFLVVFIYLPMQIGRIIAWGLSVKPYIENLVFEYLVYTFLGYLTALFVTYLSLILIARHFLPSLRYSIGAVYIILKVILLLIVEIGLYPIICGWWLDICALPLTGISLSSRIAALVEFPYFSTYMHWIAGMLFIFYFASLIILAREVLRPGVLWFLRNLNDPDFQPIREMVVIHVAKHIRRFILSSIIFALSIIIVILFPVIFLTYLPPNFLPFHFTTKSLNGTAIGNNSIAKLLFYYLDFSLLIFLLPLIFDATQFKNILKRGLTIWVSNIANLLSMESYLLGQPQCGPGRVIDFYGNTLRTVPDTEGAPHEITEVPLLAAHGYPAFKPYLRPNNFSLKLACLVGLTFITFSFISVLVLFVPCAIGRLFFCLFTEHRINDFYCILIGLNMLVIIGFVVKYSIYLYAQIQDNYPTFNQLIGLSKKLLIYVAINIVLIVIIPLLIGNFVYLTFIIPINNKDYGVSHISSHNWLLGILYTRSFLSILQMFGENRFDFILNTIMNPLEAQNMVTRQNIKLALLIILPLTLFILFPYGLKRISAVNEIFLIMPEKYIYIAVMAVLVCTKLAQFAYFEIVKLYTQIKNEKYMLGQMLVNYPHV